MHQHSRSGKNKSDVQHPRIVQSGMLVGLLTILSYAGLIVRDILMARFFGLGEEIAQFQLASYLPFFFALILSNPLYSILTPGIVRHDHLNSITSRRWFAKISGSISSCFFLAALATFLLYVLEGSGQSQNYSFLLLVGLCCAVLSMSANVIVANALLNALGRPLAAAAAPLAVPIIAISTLLIWGPTGGALALAVGMVLGQAANYFIVRSQCGHLGYTTRLWGNPGFILNRKATFKRYFPLVLVGMLLYSSQPLAVVLCRNLGSEVLAGLAIGGKGLTMAISMAWLISSSVILPHFSRLADGDNEHFMHAARRAIWGGVVFSSLMTVALFLLSPFLVAVLFEGGAFHASDTLLVSKIIAIGGLQVPFFVVIQLIEKLAAARRKSSGLVFPLLIGLVVNVLFSLMVISQHGVGGVMLGAAVGMAVAMIYAIAINIRNQVISAKTMIWLHVYFFGYGLLIWLLDRG